MKTTKIRTVVATALIAVFGAAAVAAPAQAGNLTGSVPTKVTIKGQNGDYYGKVKSSDNSCTADREVKVFKKTPSGKMLIGTDNAQANGVDYEWSIGNSGYKTGKFFAKVNPITGCGGDKSKTITR